MLKAQPPARVDGVAGASSPPVSPDSPCARSLRTRRPTFNSSRTRTAAQPQLLDESFRAWAAEQQRQPGDLPLPGRIPVSQRDCELA